MYLPLILDLKDKKWITLKKILNFLDSRATRQELTKRNIPVKNGVNAFKIVLIAMFFSIDVSYVIKELN